ncbi:MAG: hypothetical protein HeimC3_18080 [Candidatus Heimdallarchaeota archaeon LC_3]|nr:MAG: hypothetical protein HeimC3_18080 [Candidatus Heimdallarchaeota archaeon LC_3]
MSIISYDPIFNDPYPDLNFPAALEGLYINNQGSVLLGRLYVAQGSELHPTILLLHGFPGHELNLDLAHVLRRAGWNVVTFHYRGSWGSQGDFSFTHCIEDVHAVLSYLRKPEIIQKFRIDSRKIVTIGFSMGGFLSLITAYQNSSINAAASIAGVNFDLWAKFGIDEETRKILNQLLEESLLPLSGTTSQKLLEEVLENENNWNVINFVKTLSNRHLLLVGGSKDTVVPISNHHKPLVEAFHSAQTTHIVEELLEADHAFSDKRIALIKIVLKWLENLPQF